MSHLAHTLQPAISRSGETGSTPHHSVAAPQSAPLRSEVTAHATKPRTESPQHSRLGARGFGLYVGISPDELPPGVTLPALIAALQEQLALLAPAAASHAAIALAKPDAAAAHLDAVRYALHEPGACRVPQKLPAGAGAAPAGARRAGYSAHRGQVVGSVSGFERGLDTARSGIIVDAQNAVVLLDNVPADLSFREFTIMRFFALREGQTVTREEILQTVWKDAATQPSTRTVDVHIRRLRVKLGQYSGTIRTVHGSGYRFDRSTGLRIVTGAATPSPDLL